MKVTDLKVNEGILCTTEQEATAICRLMHEAGLKAGVNKDRTFLEMAEGIADFERKYPIVVRPVVGTYCSINYAETSNLKTHPASDFLTPEPSETPNQPRLIDFLKVGDKVWNCLSSEWQYVSTIETVNSIIQTEGVKGKGMYKFNGHSHTSAFPIIHLAEWHPERGEPMPPLTDPNEPRIGEVCLFWDNGYLRTIGIFTGIGNETYPYTCGDSVNFKNCIPLRGDRMPNWHELLNIKTNQPKQ